MSNLTPDDVDLRLTATKNELQLEDLRLWQGLEDEKISRVAGDKANKDLIDNANSALAAQETRLSVEVVQREEGDLRNITSLTELAQALADYRIKTDLELNNERIARQQLGVELNTRVDDFISTIDFKFVLVHQAIQTYQDETNGKLTLFDERIKKYEEMLQDITTDSIQITMDNGEINMGAWTILSQAREWDLEILGKFKDYQTQTNKDIEDALKDIQDKLPVEQDIIDKAIEALSEAQIIKDLDAKITGNIDDIDNLHKDLLKETVDRQNEMIQYSQTIANEMKANQDALVTMVQDESNARIDALQRESAIRQQELVNEAAERTAEITERIKDIEAGTGADLTEVNKRIDDANFYIETVKEGLDQERTERLADIATLNDGLTKEIQFRKEGDLSITKSLENYKATNDVAMANFREEITVVTESNKATVSRVEALDAQVKTMDTELQQTTTVAGTALDKANLALTETSALAQRVSTTEANIVQINKDVATKANSSTVQLLESRVETIDGEVKASSKAITKLNSDIDTVKNDLSHKVDATVLDQYSTTVEMDRAIASRVTEYDASLAIGGDNLWSIERSTLVNETGTVTRTLVDTKIDHYRYVTNALNATTKLATGRNNGMIPFNYNGQYYVGTKYTLTFKIRAIKAHAAKLSVFVGGLNSPITNKDLALTGDWITVTETFTLTGSSTTDIAHNMLSITTNGNAGWAVNDWYEIKEVMLQRGTKATAYHKAYALAEEAINANATAVQGIKAQVDIQEGKITSNSNSITALKNDVIQVNKDLSTKASSQALTDLKSEVTVLDGKVASNSQSVIQLNNELNNIKEDMKDMATSSALQALDSRVTSAEGTISSQQSSITKLQGDLNTTNNKVNNKAEASAVVALDQRVTSAEGKITSQTTQITDLQNSLKTTNETVSKKADTAVVNALDSKVTDIDGKVTAQGSELTTIKTSVTTAGTNLLYNGNFAKESTVNLAMYWGHWGGVAATRTFETINGKRWMRINTGTNTDTFRGISQSTLTGSFKKKTVYTLSFSARTVTGSGAAIVLIHQAGGGNNDPQLTPAPFPLTETPTRIVFTFTSADLDTKSAFNVMLGPRGGVPGDIYITDVMLTEGGLAVTWQPSNAEITAEVAATGDATRSLDTKVTTIGNKVDSNSAEITTLKNRVTKTEGDITKKADSVAVESLTNRVTQNEKDISASSDKITTLNNTVSTSTTVLAINSTVTGLVQQIGKGEITKVADSLAVGGNVLKLGGGDGFDTVYAHAPTFMPVDPNRMYRVKARYRRTHDNGGAIYIGLACKNAAQTKYVTSVGNETDDMNASNYMPMNNFPALRVWQTGEWFVKGVAPAGASGTATIADPRKFQTKAAWFTPMVIAGHGLDAATSAELDYITIEYADEYPLLDANASATSTLSSKVDTIDGKVTTLTSSVTQLTGRVNTVEQGMANKADVSALNALDARVVQNGKDISTNSAAITKVDGRIDSLSVSTNNVLLNSYGERKNNAAKDAEYLMYERSPELKAFYDENLGKECTLTFEVSIPVAGSLQVYSGNDSAHAWTKQTGAIPANTWTPVTVKFVPVKSPSNPNKTWSTLEFWGTYNTGRIPTVRKAMMVAGSVAAAWQPSPRDTIASLEAMGSAVSSLQTKTDLIDGRVTTNSNNITTLTGRVTSNEGKIQTNTTAISGLETKISNVDGKVDAASHQVTQLNTRIDNQLIGGENLVRNGDFANDLDQWGSWGGAAATRTLFTVNGKKFLRMTSTTTTSFRGIDQPSIYPYYANGEYILSFLAYTTATTPQKIRSLIHQSGDGTNDPQLYLETGELSAIPKRYYLKFKLSERPNKTSFRVHLEGNPGAPYDICISDIQVEVGNTPTEWKPSSKELQAALGANAGALTSLTTRVTAAEGKIDTQAGQITALNTSVAGKANASAVTSLEARVTTAEGNITSLTTSTTNLTNRMTAAEGKITANTGNIQTMNNKLTEVDGKVTAQAIQVNKVEATLAGGIDQRNYVLNSTVSNSNRTLSEDFDFTTLPVGTKITMSYDLEIKQAVGAGARNRIGYSIAVQAQAGVRYLEVWLQNAAAAGLYKGRLTNVITVDSKFTSNPKLIGYANQTSGGQVVAKNLQFSISQIPVTWSPAPEDAPDMSEYAKAAAVTSLEAKVTEVDGKVSSQATQITQLQTSVGQNTAKLNITAETVDGMSAGFYVKTDVDGLVSGFGTYNDGRTSAFGVNADFFYIGKASGGKKPFIVTTTPQVIDGVSYPVGTWISVALIANATIGTAHIANAAITSAKIGTAQITDAHVANLNAGKINAGFLNAARIQANTITADKLNVTELSAISANLGTIVTYKNPAVPNGTRTVMTGGLTEVFDDNNTRRFRAGFW